MAQYPMLALSALISFLLVIGPTYSAEASLFSKWPAAIKSCISYLSLKKTTKEHPFEINPTGVSFYSFLDDRSNNYSHSEKIALVDALLSLDSNHNIHFYIRALAIIDGQGVTVTELLNMMIDYKNEPLRLASILEGLTD